MKTTISDLGYEAYSEWYIGHHGSEYWKRKDSEKAEIFKKIEPYLTFLDIQQLERKGADLQTKIEELQDVNQVLRNKQNEREERIRGMEQQIQTIMNTLGELVTNQNDKSKMAKNLIDKGMYVSK